MTASRLSREKTTFLLQTQVCSGVPLYAKNSAVKHARTDLLSLAGLLHHQGQGGHQSFLDKKMVNQLQVEDKKKWGSDYSFPSEGSAKAKQPGGFQENRKPMKMLCRRIFLKLPAAKVERLRRRSEGFRHRIAISST